MTGGARAALLGAAACLAAGGCGARDRASPTEFGTRRVGGPTLEGRVVGGGRQLLVLVSEPPEPWRITLLEWRQAGTDGG